MLSVYGIQFGGMTISVFTRQNGIILDLVAQGLGSQSANKIF